jgi:hypothetical protein
MVYQEVIELGVEVVSTVFRKSFYRRIVPFEVFTYNPNNRLLHFLLENVVLALSVDFVEELLFHILEPFISLLLS